MCPFHHEGPFDDSAGARAQVDIRSEVTVALGINA